MDQLVVDGAMIEYQVQGHGEPVLLIPASLLIDGLARPLLAEPELASRYQLIHYHRRGYLGSTLGPAPQPLTIARQAGDAAALMRHLRVTAAHIAGHSIGGLIALQLALETPDRVHSLALLEPILRMVPSGKAAFEQTTLPMLNAYRAGHKRQALEIFADRVFGPNWQGVVEQAIPGGVEQAVNAMDIFIREQSAIQEWQFGATEAAAIRQPVLSVVGSRSAQLMQEGRSLLHTWFPQTEDWDVQATHLLQMQDPKGMAHGLADFFARHPLA
jgi:3-oxoadipate enol-lactonase